MKKRGLSGIIAVILVILLVLVAVGIVWVFIGNVITNTFSNDGTSEFSRLALCLDVNLEVKGCGNSTEDLYNVRVERGVGDGELMEIKFSFNTDKGKFLFSNLNATPNQVPGEFGSIEYEFDLTSLIGEKVLVYGVEIAGVFSGGLCGFSDSGICGDIELVGGEENQPPTANFIFAPNPGIENQPITFTSTSSDDGTIVSWEWDFENDGVIDESGEEVMQSYLTGSYDVNLTVTDDEGLKDSVVKLVNVVTGLAGECGDGQDNDGNGLIDMADPDCRNPFDDSESNLVGTTYYFSSTGLDSNDGLTSGTPKQTILEADSLINNAQEGDVFAFKRGDEWNEGKSSGRGISVGSGSQITGSKENPIVLTAYGSGARPLFKDFDLGSCEACVVILINGANSGEANSHILIENLHLLDSTAGTNIGISLDGPQESIDPHNITISNLIVDGFGINIRPKEASDVVIRDSLIRNARGLAGISLPSSNRVDIINNELIDNGEYGNTFDHHIYVNTCYDCSVVNNSIHGRTSGLKVAIGSDILVSGNEIYDLDSSTVTIGGRNSLALENVIFENNVIHDGPNGLNIKHQGGSGGISYNSNFTIRNNLFYNIGSSDSNAVIILQGDNAEYEDIFVYNNLIHLDSDAPGFRMGVGIDLASNINVKNNILYRPTITGSYIINNRETNWHGAVFDNNLYYKIGDTHLFDEDGGSSYDTLADVRTGLGFEANGQEGNPMFLDSGNNDYHLTSGSTLAIDNGDNLQGYVDYDYDGILRPQGNGWDIGAYEFI